MKFYRATLVAGLKTWEKGGDSKLTQQAEILLLTAHIDDYPPLTMSDFVCHIHGSICYLHLTTSRGVQSVGTASVLVGREPK